MEAWFKLTPFAPGKPITTDFPNGLLDSPPAFSFCLPVGTGLSLAIWRVAVGVWNRVFEAFTWPVFGVDIQCKEPVKPAAYTANPPYAHALTEGEIKKERIASNRVHVFAGNIWWEYRRRARLLRRIGRVIAMEAGYALILFSTLSLLQPWGVPSLFDAPYRGFNSYHLQGLILGVAISLALFHLFFVFDATFLNRTLILYLTEADTYWPHDAWQSYLDRDGAHTNGWKVDPLDLTEFLDIRFIAMRTRVVGAWVYQPFLIFTLLIIARTSLFADWNWAGPLIIAMCLNILVAFYAAFLLRRAAEQARTNALRSLRKRHIEAATAGQIERKSLIKKLIQRVQAEKEGAFSTLSQYPLVAAILLPSSSLGIWALLEVLARYRT